MKIFIKILIILTVSIFSAKGQGKNKSFNSEAYIVDTIEIINPIKIFIKKKGKYGTVITDSLTLKSFRKHFRFKKMIGHKSIYLSSANLYFYVDPNKFPGYEICSTNLTENNKNFEIHKYPKNTKFLLVLVKASCYEEKEWSMESLPLPKYANSFFVQMLFPLNCK